MLLRELTAGIDHIQGAGPAAARDLGRVGVNSVAELLTYYPRDWEDRSREVLLGDFNKSGAVCTTVTILAQDWFGSGRMRTLKVYVEDSSARAALVCFNRPFLEKQLVPGRRCRLWGRFMYKYGEIQSTSFEVELLPETDGAAGQPLGASGNNFGRILPVYPLSKDITQNLLRRLVKRGLEQYASRLENELPLPVMEKEALLPKAQALCAIHFPPDQKTLEQAKKTLIYEELFYLELMVGRRAMERRNLASRAIPPRASGEGKNSLQHRLLERLPFSLTQGQSNAVAELNQDMDSPYPMARLLQGEVGSGKTLVSFMAALKAIERGGQAVIMAPTELLARQHAENAAKLLEPLGLRIAFLTGNLKAGGRGALLGALASGDIDMAVGTHALFSKDVAYKNLSLVVVDEQHRFGVLQRHAIMAKGNTPDLLMMSATPIPRTLALTVFGDLDVSVIRDLPPGRKPVRTHLARESSEERVYAFIRGELEKGRQAYFVYPLIEADAEKDLKDAQSMARRLAEKIFPAFRSALVHSRLDEEEKRNTMELFRRGEVQILVATSVVEVGVDVPNATCMTIEHAERFGLSALHQLRGRVGRGGEQSYCFLVYSDELTDDGKTRLKVMLENHDGFVIAEEDLKLRGPGQIIGIEQSGYLNLALANPVRDQALLERTRETAFAILKDDPLFNRPENQIIAGVLRRSPPFSDLTL
ncbi:MAG: ATP-dependent DNA helicase RecG [Spirochaetaceae bacterium]|jgi:ATP-dependent DNA helicase RecG|nr:ATP-dependent DNA helicase RecG [Spirochaetaceae bacterium]